MLTLNRCRAVFGAMVVVGLLAAPAPAAPKVSDDSSPAIAAIERPRQVFPVEGVDLRGIAPCEQGVGTGGPNCQREQNANATAFNLFSTNVADDFRPAVSGSVTRVCWSGFYVGVASGGAPPTGTAGNFTVRYFLDAGGAPGAQTGPTFSTATGTPAASQLTITAQTPTGRMRFAAGVGAGQTNEEFEISATHAAVAVTAGTCYWVEIHKTLTPAFYILNAVPVPGAAPGNDAFIQAAPAVAGGAIPAYSPSQRSADDVQFCVNVALELTSCPSPIAAPANDTCAGANAVTLTDGGQVNRTGTTTGATGDGLTGAAFCAGNPANSAGVWYRFTGLGHEVVVSTCNAATPTYDSVIQVFTGTCGGTLNCVAGNDDDGFCANGLASTVDFCARAGQVYLVYVREFFNNGGAFTINFIDGGVANACGACSITPPAGATPENEPSCGLDIIDTQTNLGCSDDPVGGFTALTGGQTIASTSGVNGAQSQRDVDWYRFVVPAGATQFTLTVAAEFDAQLIVEFTATDSCDDAIVQFDQNIPATCAGQAFGIQGLTGGQVFYAIVLPPAFSSPTCGEANNDYTIALAFTVGTADCNLNGTPDAAEIAANPALDCFNRAAPAGTVGGSNGVLDSCECQGDFDRSGEVNANDISNYVNAWYLDIVSGTVLADIDCTGETNANDISAFINIWFNQLVNNPTCQ